MEPSKAPHSVTSFGATKWRDLSESGTRCQVMYTLMISYNKSFSFLMQCVEFVGYVFWNLSRVSNRDWPISRSSRCSSFRKANNYLITPIQTLLSFSLFCSLFTYLSPSDFRFMNKPFFVSSDITKRVKSISKCCVCCVYFEIIKSMSKCILKIGYFSNFFSKFFFLTLAQKVKL